MFGELSGCDSYRECYQHLVGRGLGCCSTSCRAQDSSPYNYLAPNVTVAVKKPWYRLEKLIIDDRI